MIINTIVVFLAPWTIETCIQAYFYTSLCLPISLSQRRKVIGLMLQLLEINLILYIVKVSTKESYFNNKQHPKGICKFKLKT